MTIRTHLVLASCMVLAGCRERSSPKGSQDPASFLHETQHPDTTSSLPAERTRVNGVGVGEASSDVRATLGRPDSVSAPQKFEGDRKSTRLNSSHTVISYAVFCLKKKTKKKKKQKK